MNTQQPEALRLADELRAAPERSRTSFEAAAELRRLHEESERLKAQQQEPVAWKDEQGNVRMTLDAGEIQSSVGYVYSVHGERIKNACIRSDIPNGTPLYTSPPASKPWVGLTDDEVNKIRFDYVDYEERAKAIEAKLREKNA